MALKNTAECAVGRQVLTPVSKITTEDRAGAIPEHDSMAPLPSSLWWVGGNSPCARRKDRTPSPSIGKSNICLHDIVWNVRYRVALALCLDCLETELGVHVQCGLLLLTEQHTFPSNATLSEGFIPARNTGGQGGFSCVGTMQRKTLIPLI